MADLDDGPFVDTKRLPGGFRETDLVPREELAIDLEERCGDRPITVADIDLGVRSKAFSMTDRNVAPHDGDQLMMRVETQTACAREGRFRSEAHTFELQSLMRISYAVYGLTKTQ